MIAIFAASEKLGVMLACCPPEDHQAVAVAIKALSRWSRRNDGSSEPREGWVLGVPFLTRRTRRTRTRC
jgi:hypothetical protein